VEDNTVNGKPLVYLEDISDYKVEDAGQVILVNCSNITVENRDLTNTSVSIALLNTENSKISNNTACNNWGGIRLYYSSNNTITFNNVSNNDEGIRLDDSSNNFITGNNVSNNVFGIYLYYSSNNNTITGNVFVNGGLSVYFSYQNTVEDNTVNGKSLVYLEDVSDYKVEDAGQVIIVNCNNISIENLDLSNTDVGIVLGKTENSKISNNTVCNNNWGGIRLEDSSNNNTITGNNVSSNNYWSGIQLSFSSNNKITGNNVSNNNRGGIRLYYSSNNKVYFNNFINNTDNVDSYKSTNIWNSPLEITYTYSGTAYTNYLGNYWDDYEGTDADGDGIGDTHYSIYSESDDYPLMKPFENYYILTSAHA
jgi:parallel beta-helix repeat protein